MSKDAAAAATPATEKKPTTTSTAPAVKPLRYDKDGILLKLSTGFFKGSWQSRHFALSKLKKSLFFWPSTQDYLEHIKTHKQTNDENDCIPLHQASVYVASDYMRKEFCFEISTPLRNYFLCANSDEDMKEWMSSIVDSGVVAKAPERPLLMWRDDSNEVHYERPSNTAAYAKYGYLQKRGAWNTMYKTRFFRTTETAAGDKVLAYYKTAESQQPNAYIPLYGIQIKEIKSRSGADDGLEFSLTIPGGRTYCLKAQSKSDRTAWLRILDALSKDDATSASAGTSASSRAFTHDFYGVLAVQPNASTTTITQAYKELAKQLHPDKNPDDPDAPTKFALLAEAYGVLRDPARRVEYDKQRKRLADEEQKQKLEAEQKKKNGINGNNTNGNFGNSVNTTATSTPTSTNANSTSNGFSQNSSANGVSPSEANSNGTSTAPADVILIRKKQRTRSMMNLNDIGGTSPIKPDSDAPAATTTATTNGITPSSTSSPRHNRAYSQTPVLASAPAPAGSAPSPIITGQQGPAIITEKTLSLQAKDVQVVEKDGVAYRRRVVRRGRQSQEFPNGLPKSNSRVNSIAEEGDADETTPTKNTNTTANGTSLQNSTSSTSSLSTTSTSTSTASSSRSVAVNDRGSATAPSATAPTTSAPISSSSSSSSTTTSSSSSSSIRSSSSSSNNSTASSSSRTSSAQVAPIPATPQKVSSSSSSPSSSLQPPASSSSSSSTTVTPEKANGTSSTTASQQTSPASTNADTNGSEAAAADAPKKKRIVRRSKIVAN